MLFSGKFCNEVLRDALLLKGETRYSSVLEKTNWADALGFDEYGLVAVLHGLRFRFIPEFKVPRKEEIFKHKERLTVYFPVPEFWYQESPLTFKDWARLNTSPQPKMAGSEQPVRHLNLPLIRQFLEKTSMVEIPTVLEWESACFQAYPQTVPGWASEYGVHFSLPFPESKSFWNEKCDITQIRKRDELSLEDEKNLELFPEYIQHILGEQPQDKYWSLPVKCFPANRLGLYDFLHTIGEWAFDEASETWSSMGGLQNCSLIISNPDRQPGYFSKHGIRLVVRPV